jgi:hypothetical protein
MESQNQIINLAFKWFPARAIHEDLAATLGADGVSDSWITRYLRETCCSGPTDAASSVYIPTMIDDANQASLAALDETPFASIRHVSQLTHLSFSTVSRQLAQSLG